MLPVNPITNPVPCVNNKRKYRDYNDNIVNKSDKSHGYASSFIN